MRTRITLACTECKQRNYSTTKDSDGVPPLQGRSCIGHEWVKFHQTEWYRGENLRLFYAGVIAVRKRGDLHI